MSKDFTTFTALNLLLICALVLIRIEAAGWFLLLLGLVTVLPITVFHVIASTKGFQNYFTLPRICKIFLWASVLLFALFILFQEDADDAGTYSVINVFTHNHFGKKNFYLHSEQDENIFFIVPIICALLLILADILILIRISKIRKLQKRNF